MPMPRRSAPRRRQGGTDPTLAGASVDVGGASGLVTRWVVAPVAQDGGTMPVWEVIRP